MVLSHPRLQLILGLDCWCPWSDLGERASLAALPQMLWAWTAVPTRSLPLTRVDLALQIAHLDWHSFRRRETATAVPRF